MVLTLNSRRGLPSFLGQGGTIGNPTPLDLLSAQPRDPAKGPFTLKIGGAQFQSTWDSVLYYGYNMASNGGRVLASEPKLGMAIEQDYEFPAGTHLMEMYWEYISSDGSKAIRPFFTQIDRTTSLASISISPGTVANSYTSFEFGSSYQLLKLQNGALYVMQNVPWTWNLSGAKKLLRALNNAGSSGLDVIQTSAADEVRIGDGNATGHAAIKLETKTNSPLFWRAGATKNNLGLNAESYGGGDGVVYIGNAATVPASNPSAGGILYTEAGALKYRGSSGTVTVLGNA